MSYTSRLLNYVEPYYIDGIAKTAFWSEVNTNIEKNDKVFIVNGFYDSERFIQKGKWTKNADGYRVLFIDRCKIVLDIDWESGIFAGLTQTYREDNIDNFIKVHHIRSQREFDYINKIQIDTYSASRVSKFEKNKTNNLIYSDIVWNGSSGLGANNGLDTTKSFWAREGTDWVALTNNYINNTFTFSSEYFAAGLTNNNRIYVLGEDIFYADTILKERNIYKWTGSASWVLDTEYKQPVISKLYFKEGVFKGTHNDGVFGSYRKQEIWSGTPSVWNSGFFVNSIWQAGKMNSKSTVFEQSYYSSLVDGRPVQTTDFSNNRGNGYNYVLDSDVFSGQILNGNFINSNLGIYDIGMTAVADYFGVTNSYQVLMDGGLYNYCDINNSVIGRSTTLDSIIKNSKLLDTRALNSQIKESYSIGGEFSVTEASINVITADLSSYMTASTSATFSSIRSILKLYIRDSDLNRLDNLDSFYISKMNKEFILSKLDSDLRIWLPLETRYILDTFFDFAVNGVDQECIATLKSKVDNKYLPIIEWSGSAYSNTATLNTNEFASIDIDLSKYLAFYKYQNEFYFINQTYLDKSTVADVFSRTTLTNSDFRDGLIDGINWSSGSHVNRESNIIKLQNGLPKITRFSDNEIKVYLNKTQPTINDTILRKGQYVWLDSIRHTNNTGQVTNLTGVYTIATYSSDELILKSDALVGMSSSGTFSAIGTLKPTYLSVHRLLIQNSVIRNGLFIRNLFRNSTFENEAFDSNDISLHNSNIQQLRILNHYFINSASSSNTVKSGLFHNSHFIDVNWESGIADNSIWSGPEFKGGVFNYGIWRTGTFSGGRFQNSRGLTFSPEDYTYETNFYRNWYDGTFNGGEVFNSVWLNGTFNLGKFYNSDWYGGVWNNGILGDKNIPTSNTTMAKYLNIGTGATQTLWYNGMVENAEVGGEGYIDWYDGKFNGGIFTSVDLTPKNHSIWYYGQFNGGNFTGMAKWKDGIFNSGKFNSHYGWTMSSSTQSIDYAWEYGEFRGGQFGEESTATNSTWWDGQFYGGIFKGRVWNSGIFLGGLFEGSGTNSVRINESSFVESFTNSYWGLWRSGTVTELKHKADPSFVVPVNDLRFEDRVEPLYATIKNTLWLNGVVNHPNSELNNLAWLRGRFKKGNFKNGVFNPYVRRDYWDNNFTSTHSFNLNLADCIWENGDFDGDFYISDWLNGNFNMGTMSGARWFDGVWNYGNADNIYWENGTWKNGNWDGSPFDLNTLTFTQSEHRMNSGKERDILTRVANVHKDGKIHVINAFSGTFSELQFDSWTFSNTSASLTDWKKNISNYYYLDIEQPNIPQISVTQTQFNFPDGANTTTIAVTGTIAEGDEYRVYMYGGYISITASSTDTTSTIATRLIDEVNRGVYLTIVKYEQWTANGYLIRLLTWEQGDSRFSQNFPFAQSTLNANELEILTPSDTYPYVQAISGFIPTSAYSQSEKLYALINDISGITSSIFTQSDSLYNITIDVYNYFGRTDFKVKLGGDEYLETLLTTGPKILNYSKSSGVPTSSSDAELYIERIMYSNPDNSSFEVRNLKISLLESNYDTINNRLYQFATYSEPFNFGASGPTVSLPGRLITGVIAENEKVSIKYGNGIFKYGLWENGYWNNGWYASWDGTPEYYLFTDVVQGGFLEVSPNLWIIKLMALRNTEGLNIGDRVSVGNIVFVDVNENRRLQTKWYRVINKTEDTITLEININFSLRRIERDSSLHLIYVSKKIWQFGIFHNGYFKGIWNYGLFRGYPYITEMHESHWIDGIFDGGTFKSSKSDYLSLGASQSYNNGLVQNFTFRDNNKAGAGLYKYDSWVETNVFTYSMTNLLRDNLRFDNDWGVVLSSGNLKGFPSEDVLSSKSIFRNSFDDEIKYYNLGIKYRIYNDFLKASAYFSYPFNTKGQPGVAEFLANGWTYTANFIDIHGNAKSSAYQAGGTDDNVLQVNYTIESYNKVGVKFVQANKLRFTSNNIHIIADSGPSGDGPSTSLDGDFSSLVTPAGRGAPVVEINGVVSPSTRFSNISYVNTAWPLRTALSNQIKLEFDIENKVNFIAYSNIGSGSPVPPRFTVIGDSIVNKRRVYQFDRYSLSSVDPQLGGYENNSNPAGFTYSQVALPSNLGGSAINQMIYQVKANTRLRMNAFIPFKFFATEKGTAGWLAGSNNLRQRFGWSIFKLIGVVEKIPAAERVPSWTTIPESAWKFVTATELNFFPGSALGSIDRSGNLIGFVIDKVNCTIAFDSTYQDGTWPPASNKYFKGYLQITNFEADFGQDDLIRFRLYWLDVRKMFTSSHTNGRGAPGYMDLIIGKDTDIPYTENNHGYFEITDLNTYTNQNTNLLDNTKANAIEKFRYSVVDFDLQTPPSVQIQGTSSTWTDQLPNIFLLNSDYPNLPGGFDTVVNHGMSPGNKKEYFYNRKSLNLFFKSVEAFSAKFSKIQFYETDMIPFFRYTDEASVNSDPQSPYYGTAPLVPFPEGSLSLDTPSFTSPFEGDLRGIAIIPGGGGQGGGGPLPPVVPPSVNFTVTYTFTNNSNIGLNEFTSFFRIQEYDALNVLVRTITADLTSTDIYRSGSFIIPEGHRVNTHITATASAPSEATHQSVIQIYSGFIMVANNDSFVNTTTFVNLNYVPTSNINIIMEVNPETIAPPPDCYCYRIQNEFFSPANYTYTPCGGVETTNVILGGTTIWVCSSTNPTGEAGVTITPCMTTCMTDGECEFCGP